MTVEKEKMDWKYQVSWVLLPMTVCVIIFGNHYARDAVGALEKQLEDPSSGLRISAIDYATMNTLYFSPNTIMPLVAGMMSTDRPDESSFGLKRYFPHSSQAARIFLISVMIGSIGHIVFSLGIEFKLKAAIFGGRFLAGTMYEVVDSVPLIFLAPLYQQYWGVLVGCCNSFLRLGSVLNFILSPWLYQHYGLPSAFWMATGIASFGVICALLSVLSEMTVRERNHIDSHSDTESSHSGEQQITAKDYDNPTATNVIQQNDAWITRIWMYFMTLLPLHVLSIQFYYFLCGGAALYGSMVPFWFIGSKFLQDGYGLNVSSADLLVLLPEGMITIISIPIGYIIDHANMTLRSKLRYLACSVLFLPLCYICLILRAHSEKIDSEASHGMFDRYYSILVMVLLGFGYGISNCFFNSCALFVICGENEDSNSPRGKLLLGLGTGLMACAMNILPTLIPPIATIGVRITKYDGTYLLILSVVGVVSCILFMISSCYGMSSESIEYQGFDENSQHSSHGLIRSGGIELSNREHEGIDVTVSDISNNDVLGRRPWILSNQSQYVPVVPREDNDILII